VFFREIQSIEKYAPENEKIASKFIDMSEENTIDQDSCALLNELKNKIESHLPEKNIQKINVSFFFFRMF
jgi:hypothetical protein